MSAVNSMKFVKQSFMGIELDILTGHPEHDILFIATQVARAAGLKNASHASFHTAKAQGHKHAMQLGTLGVPAEITEGRGHTLKATSWLFSESAVYQMLLRGHAPASEPFRKWVTEIVLPSIRKTGKFDANEAQDKASIQFSGEFAQLHAALSELTSSNQMLAGEVRSLKDIIAGLQIPSLEGAAPSPYEGQPGGGCV